MVLEIQEFTEINRNEWDKFVNNHPEGRFSQLSGYKDVLEKTYQYEPSYWLFRNAEKKLIGVFPSFIKRSKILGNKLISQPFCEYGGLLEDSLNDQDCILIKEKLGQLLTKHRLPYVEVHGGMGLRPDNRRIVFNEKALHQYAVLKLTTSNNVWDTKMNRMVRKAVRKAQNSGLECYQETTERSLKEDFYPLYLSSMKKFGTPPHPVEFFLGCLCYLPDYMRLFLVKEKQKVVSVLLGFITGKRVHIVSTASDEGYWDKRPNDLVHWEFIRWACDSGYKYFDFGPVRYAGQRQFKEKWGVDFFDYSYYYFFNGKNKEKNLAYSDNARIFAFLWSKLIPLPLSRLAGPALRKRLGD